MKIAVTSTGPTLDDSVEARFGRCAYFLIIDPDTLEVEPLENPNVALGGGAGPQSAQLMANQGVSVVLTGNCGPNAFRTFGAANIQVITGVSGRVRDAVQQFSAGTLGGSSAPSVDSNFGMGGGGGRGMGGGGRGMGGGGGRGMGGGGGRGMGGGGGQGMGGGGRGMGAATGGTVSAGSNPPAGKQGLEDLKKTAEELRRQMEAIQAKIQDLERE